MQPVPGIPSHRVVSRRSALRGLAVVSVGGTGLLAGQGCTVRNPFEDRPEPEPAPVDPDIALRDSARGAIAAQLLLVERARPTPGTRTRLADLARLHATHLAALDAGPTDTSSGDPSGDPSSDPSTTAAPPRPADVLAGERALQAQLAGFAQRAESGGFARLLASMAAALAQREQR